MEAMKQHHGICCKTLQDRNTSRYVNISCESNSPVGLIFSFSLCWHIEKYACIKSSCCYFFCFLPPAYTQGSPWSHWPQHWILNLSGVIHPLLHCWSQTLWLQKDQDNVCTSARSYRSCHYYEVLSRLQICSLSLLAKWPSTELRDSKWYRNGGTLLQAALPLEAGSNAAALLGHRLSDGRQHPASTALQHQSGSAKPGQPAPPVVPLCTSYCPQDCRLGHEGTLQMGCHSGCVWRGSQGRRATLDCFPKPRGPTLASSLVSQSAARESRAKSLRPEKQQAQR